LYNRVDTTSKGVMQITTAIPLSIAAAKTDCHEFGGTILEKIGETLECIDN